MALKKTLKFNRSFPSGDIAKALGKNVTETIDATAAPLPSTSTTAQQPQQTSSSTPPPVEQFAPLPGRVDMKKAFAERPVHDFVVPGLLKGGLGMVAAPGGTGKSYFLLALAASVATGKPLLPSWPAMTPKRVIVLLAEDPPDIVWDRSHFLGQPLTEEERDLLHQNLEAHSLTSFVPTLFEEEFRMESRKKITSMTPLARQIEFWAKDARLVILDPIRRFHQSDENDASQATYLVQLLEGIAFRSGAAFVFSHHTSKQASLSGQGDVQQAARGSSAFTDGVRWQSNLIGMTEDEAKKFGKKPKERKQFVRWCVTKGNYIPPMEDVWFRRAEGGALHLCNPADLDFGLGDKPSDGITSFGGRNRG